MLKFDQESESVLISIKPEYVSQIISGKKKVEFRKKSFKRKVNRLIIYSSSPIQKIVAISEVKSINIASVKDTWRKYSEIAGISKDKFQIYYSGKSEAVAIELGIIKILKNPVPLQQLSEELIPPQSYQYLSNTKLRKLEKRAYSNVIL